MRIGFIGLGIMGTPMALNLSRHFPVTVWNRTPSRYPPLIKAGAKVSATPAQVAEQSEVIFTMLFDATAIETILEDLKKALAGKILINTSSISEAFSYYLAKEVSKAGGEFIEMPVSGSKLPAEKGQLVGMLGGDVHVVNKIRHILKPITCAAIHCGPHGYGLKTKYAVNLYVTTLAVGLAESMNLAKAQGLDLAILGEVISAGPAASVYAQNKITKITTEDWSPQATTKDCYKSSKLICAALKATGARSPLTEICCSMYAEAINSGYGDEDMISIIKTLSHSSPS
ncbi:hypothetical protein F5Y01DRAFT_325496 [Xylaria sp. FL0043]|nr:hypothetical protein F5Y01DRAFT_325496 [Xylaria sp. FL0043]